MLFAKKISFAKYLGLSFLPYLVGMCVEQTIRACAAYTVIFICVVINQIMLVNAVHLMVEAVRTKERSRTISRLIVKGIIIFVGI